MLSTTAEILNMRIKPDVRQSFSEPILAYHYPAIIGQKWTINTGVSDGDTIECEYTVESINEEVTTPFGILTGCYKLKMLFYYEGFPPFYKWIKSGVGTVKFAYEAEEQGVFIEAEMLLIYYYIQ